MRRLGRLSAALAVPWAICGGVLAFVLIAFPAGSPVLPWRVDADDIIVVIVGDEWPHPRLLEVTVNPNALSVLRNGIIASEAADESGGVWPAGAVGWETGTAPGDAGRYFYGFVSLWWLAGLPLTWSGINLWRDRRRQTD